MKHLQFSLIYLALIIPVFSFASTTNGTIIEKYAWGENTGWVNFATTNSNISITDSAITGYAWDSRFGWINMAPTNGGVLNDGEGNLSGNAWSAGGGWINFDNVTINSSGKFTGIASGDIYGQLTFNCDNCNVTTDWRPASSRTVTETPSTPSSNSSGGGGSFIQRILPFLQTSNTQKDVTLKSSNSHSNLLDEEEYVEGEEYIENEKKSKEKTTTFTLVSGEEAKEKTSIVSKILKTTFAIVVISVVFRVLAFFLRVLA